MKKRLEEEIKRDHTRKGGSFLMHEELKTSVIKMPYNKNVHMVECLARGKFAS